MRTAMNGFRRSTARAAQSAAIHLLVPLRLVSLSQADYGRIDAEAGVIEKQPAVDFAHVHFADDPLQDHPGGFLQVERNAEILGEVVQGAERKYAQWNTALEYGLGAGVDGAIAASNHERVASVVHLAPHGGAEL